MILKSNYTAAHDCRTQKAVRKDFHNGIPDTAPSLASDAQFAGILRSQEAEMEQKIRDAALAIAGRPGIRMVLIAGPSSSGKTTFSQKLSDQLRTLGFYPHPIATDNYFKDLRDTPKDRNGQYDLESLDAMDVLQFNQDMNALLQGQTVELPSYNFKKGMREYCGDFLKLGPQDLLVIEGIHCLNDSFTYALPQESQYRIFISCFSAPEQEARRGISSADNRLLRRITRDARTRGYSAEATLAQWPSVCRGEASNILPFRDRADLCFSSAFGYELSVLKPFASPLLAGIPEESPVYPEARRLLHCLSRIPSRSAESVPEASLLREFIGGGCYKS